MWRRGNDRLAYCCYNRLAYCCYNCTKQQHTACVRTTADTEQPAAAPPRCAAWLTPAIPPPAEKKGGDCTDCEWSTCEAHGACSACSACRPHKRARHSRPKRSQGIQCKRTWRRLGESLSLFQSSTLTLEPRRRTSGDGHFHFQLLPDVLTENDRLHRRTPRKIAQTVPPPRQRSGSGLRVEG